MTQFPTTLLILGSLGGTSFLHSRRNQFQDDTSHSIKTDSMYKHGFADASESAYAAVVYIRSVYEDTSTEVKLVTAKTRVAPLKRLSIPRLELCVAQLLAKLLDVTRRALSIPLQDVYCWTDSTIVLAWLDGQPRRYKTYVGNRVSATLHLMTSDKWHHVPTDSNPADCASRGLLPRNSLEHSLWWNGPRWLCKSPIQWLSMLLVNPPEDHMEVKTISYVATAGTTWLTNRYSSYHKLRTTVAWLVRFCHNCKQYQRNDAYPHNCLWTRYREQNYFGDCHKRIHSPSNINVWRK